MDAQSIVAVSAAVVALTQLVKWGGLPDRFGVFAVLVLAAVGVGVWAWSQTVPVDRTWTWPLFAGWITVSTSAAGVFGFARAVAPEHVTALRRPPPGAGQNPTVKL